MSANQMAYGQKIVIGPTFKYWINIMIGNAAGTKTITIMETSLVCIMIVQVLGIKLCLKVRLSDKRDVRV